MTYRANRTMVQLAFGAFLTRLLAGAIPAAADATICMIDPTLNDGKGLSLVAHVPSAGDFEFPSSAKVGIPVDVDLATGTFTVQRAGLPEIIVDTQGGPANVQLAGGTVPGSIDAAGNVSIPGIHLDTTFFGITLPVDLTLSTAKQSHVLNGVDYPTSGTPLDFTTGLVTLEGSAILLNAPIVDITVVSGVRITCRLDPIPDPTKLSPPASAQGLTLQGLVGTQKAGPKDTGDILTLKTKIVPGQAGLDLSQRDLFVRIAGNQGADFLVLFVRADSLKGKGKRRTAHAVSVLIGQKAGGTASGTATLVSGRKSARLTLRVGGLDLSGLTDALSVSVHLGANIATSDAALTKHAKVEKFKAK